MMKKQTVLMLLTVPALALAGVPQPSTIYYGQAKDAYGHPYMQGTEVALSKGTNELVRHTVDGILASGVNFKLKVEMESGAADPAVAHEGDALELTIWVDGIQRTMLESSLLTAAAPGAVVPLSITTGTDSDGDGLPDEWEQQMMEASLGAITNTSQITKDGDFDGDGVSNGDEYLAGTFAFLDFDVFAMDQLERTASGLIAFRFLSNAGMSYHVETTAGLGGTNEWSNGYFSMEEESPASLSGLVGDGYFKTVFIEMTEDQRFMRLITQ